MPQMQLDWTDYSFDFEDMGSLRDVIIRGTSLADWEEMLNFMREDYDFAYTVDGEDADYPGSAADAFEQMEDSACGFRVDIGGITLRGMLYQKKQIEMDFEPVDVQDQQSFDVLVDFLEKLSEKIGKPIVVTQEMSPDDVILTVGPDD